MSAHLMGGDVDARPGTYALILRSDSAARVRIGHLGVLAATRGYYVYIGSAFGPGGLAARLPDEGLVPLHLGAVGCPQRRGHSHPVGIPGKASRAMNRCSHPGVRHRPQPALRAADRALRALGCCRAAGRLADVLRSAHSAASEKRTMMGPASMSYTSIGPSLTALVAVAVLSAQAVGQCEILQLQRPGGSDGDIFGASLAVDGDVAVIGDTSAYESIGAAYVFRHDGSTWAFEAELACPAPTENSVFGIVAVSGDVVIVGDYGAETPEFNQGAAYVYRYDAGTQDWSLEASLTASDGDYGDRLGYSVAVHGDLAVAGAPWDENGDIKWSGAAYVYRFVNGAWKSEARLAPTAPAQEDHFGASVSVLSDVVLVGAVARDTAAPDAGAAFVFRHDGEEWALEAELTPFDASGGELSGYSVALAENVALAGAPGEATWNGAAYLFRFTGSEWIHEAKLMGSQPVDWPNFGRRVTIDSSATTALIGAPFDSEAGPESGAAYLFHRDDVTWVEVVKLLPSAPQWGGQFGAVGLSGDIGFVGAGGQSEWPGRVYVFAGMTGVDCNHNDQPDACDIFEGTSEDLNTNGIPDECEAIGDLNGDGRINVADLLLLLGAWGDCGDPCPPPCSGDLDGDCRVAVMDLLRLLMNWD